MVIDTSAIVAILKGEPDAKRFVDAIAGAERRLMSSINLLEASVVGLLRRGEHGDRELDLLLHRAGIEIVPFTTEHADLARSAYRRFGKGIHPARLNLCDCCAYALAKLSREPLLFKGDDFRQTDVTPAL